MSKAIIKHTGLSAEAQHYIAASMSANTARGYASDLRDWSEWCTDNKRNASKPEPMDIANYLSKLARHGMKHSTLHRRVSAIRKALSVAALDGPAGAWIDPTRDPRVSAVLSGIARKHGVERYKKEALEVEALRKAVAPIGYTVRECRDRALMCMLFAGALRGSELLALKVADVKDRGDHITVRIVRSKTDQVAKGQTIVMPATGDAACPVQAYRDWIEAAGINSGYVFRRVYRNERGVGAEHLTHHALAAIVKARTAAAGLKGDFSGHSGRRGFVTSAQKRGVHDADIMAVTRHKALSSMYGYRQTDGADQMRAISAVFNQSR